MEFNDRELQLIQFALRKLHTHLFSDLQDIKPNSYYRQKFRKDVKDCNLLANRIQEYLIEAGIPVLDNEDVYLPHSEYDD